MIKFVKNNNVLFFIENIENIQDVKIAHYRKYQSISVHIRSYLFATVRIRIAQHASI